MKEAYSLPRSFHPLNLKEHIQLLSGPSASDICPAACEMDEDYPESGQLIIAGAYLTCFSQKSVQRHPARAPDGSRFTTPSTPPTSMRLICRGCHPAKCMSSSGEHCVLWTIIFIKMASFQDLNNTAGRLQVGLGDGQKI